MLRLQMKEALEGFKLLSYTEGIIPALESAHAVVMPAKIAPEMSKDQILIVNLSGRGDKRCANCFRFDGVIKILLNADL